MKHILALALSVAAAGRAYAVTPAPTSSRTATATATPTRTTTPTRTRRATPTPLLVADANCDGHGSAPDLTAATIVSGDGTQFPQCADADPFRDRALTDADFLPVLHDIFGTFDPPWTPTPSASPTITRTARPSVTPTVTPPVSATPTSSATASPTPTSTPSETPTHPPTPSPTNSATRTRTATRTPSATPIPTGIAYQLSGDWFANWTGHICFLNGQQFVSLQDTTYRVTAVNGQLDIAIAGGATIGRGLALNAQNTVTTTFRQPGNVCALTGVTQEFVFNYTFTFATNGTGSASVHWTYGFNTFCSSCEVDDTATLRRVAGPGNQ